jgi:Spy/CpxP family protein refolding chaperone
MSYRRLACLAASLVVFAGIGLAVENPRGKHNCVLDAMAERLGITPAQKEQLDKIHSDFEQKAKPIYKQMWAQFREHKQAVNQILTADQRKELPQVMKSARLKMLESFETKLGLNEQQKKDAARICNDYTDKFNDLGDKSDDQAFEKFLALKQENMEAFCQILTPEQRVKLPGLIQEEFASGEASTSKNEFRNLLGEKLNLSTDQKQQFEKICNDFTSKIDKQKEQLQTLWQQKIAAVEKVLTADQQKKFRELIKTTD